METLLNRSIEVISISFVVWLTVQYSIFVWRRCNASPKQIEASPEPAVQLDSEIDEAKAMFVSVIDRYRQPQQEPEPQQEFSTADLILFAKQLAKKGQYTQKALKWAYDRHLSEQVRSDLLQRAMQAAAA